MKLLAWIPLLAAGCGPDLARLETEEESLNREVTTLRGDVVEMRARMEAMGLLPTGPVAGSTLPSGESDLDDALEVQVTRDGAPPEFPSLGSPERRENTDCGYRFGADWLANLSDTNLEKTGSGKASPLLLKKDGKPLSPHANPQASERSCGYAFIHKPAYLFFAPDAVDAIDGSWTLSLSDEVPMRRGGDQHPLYWVYPGTTLTFAFQKGWADEWGIPTVKLDARVVYVGTPETPAAQPGSPATVEFSGHEAKSGDSNLGVEEVIEPPQGPWTIEISSPSDGPYVLVNTLVVGNDQHARVVAVEGNP